MKTKLTIEQRQQLYEWAAQLMRLSEINDRAAKFDPPFKVDYLQLKWARKRAGVKFHRDLARHHAEIVARARASDR